MATSAEQLTLDWPSMDDGRPRWASGGRDARLMALVRRAPCPTAILTPCGGDASPAETRQHSLRTPSESLRANGPAGLPG